jgi:hypothetical protein
MRLTGVNGRLLSVEWYQSDGIPAPVETDGPVRAFSSPRELARAERELLHLLVKGEGRSTAGGAGCLFVSGFLLLLVPVIGSMIGPPVIFMGLSALLLPTQAFKLFFREDYNRLKAMAHYAVRNAYLNLHCPSCGAPWTSPYWVCFFLKDPEEIDCGVCNRRIVRKGDDLTLV